MKTKGFTIVELLITLLISSVLVSMMGSVYFLATGYQRKIKLKAASTLGHEELKFWMLHDFDQVMDYQLQGNMMELQTTKGKVIYLLNENNVMRVNAMGDTAVIECQPELRRKYEEGFEVCISSEAHVDCFKLDPVLPSKQPEL